MFRKTNDQILDSVDKMYTTEFDQIKTATKFRFKKMDFTKDKYDVVFGLFRLKVESDPQEYTLLDEIDLREELIEFIIKNGTAIRNGNIFNIEPEELDAQIESITPQKEFDIEKYRKIHGLNNPNKMSNKQTCTSCNEGKDISFFIKKKSNDPPQTICTKCMEVYHTTSVPNKKNFETAVEKYKQQTEEEKKPKDYSKGSKTCLTCMDVLPIGSFSYTKGRKNTMASCKKCISKKRVDSQKQHKISQTSQIPEFDEIIENPIVSIEFDMRKSKENKTAAIVATGQHFYCHECRQTKPTEDFIGDEKTGYLNWCKDCLPEKPTPKKPPLGLTPRAVHNEQRIGKILDAVERYANELKQIPIEWIEEYNELIETLKK